MMMMMMMMMMRMMMMSLNKAWRSASLTRAFRQVGACGGDSLG